MAKYDYPFFDEIIENANEVKKPKVFETNLFFKQSKVIRLLDKEI